MANDHEYSSAELMSIEWHKNCNVKIWESLRAGGLDTSQAVDVDFWCDGRDEDLIREMAILLRDKFGYEVNMTATDYANGEKTITIYELQGKRSGIQIDEQNINDWCDFMVRVSHDFGCRFDGWGVLYKRNE